MNIAIWNAVEFVSPDGTPLSLGSLDVPLNLSSQVPPQVFQAPLTLATNAIGLLWDAATGPADFTYAYIVSDTGDPANGWVMLELTTDENNLIGTRYATVSLAAGIPFTLGSSASFANYGQNFSAGTLSKIQRVKAKNYNIATASLKMIVVL